MVIHLFFVFFLQTNLVWCPISRCVVTGTVATLTIHNSGIAMLLSCIAEKQGDFKSGAVATHLL